LGDVLGNKLTAIWQSDNLPRNHNPRVGGSSPSSATNPINELGGFASPRGSAWVSIWVTRQQIHTVHRLANTCDATLPLSVALALLTGMFGWV
jgi:hypothetical protein